MKNMSRESDETPRHTPLRAVSEHALIARINRRFADDGKMFLRKTRRNSNLRREWGVYYVVDSYKRFVEGIDDLAEFARAKGSLEPGEYVEKDE